MTRCARRVNEAGIRIEDLVKCYPRLYHMAAAKNLPSIKCRGLLSTSTLLRCFQVPETQRLEVETCRRPKSVEKCHPDGSVAEVRDQKPMSDEKLSKCLKDGLTPCEWYRLLNSKVFFWVTHRRLEKMLNAKAYRKSRHAVFIVDTESLLADCLERVTLSPINSGSTLFDPAPRGRCTFLPLHEYPFRLRRKKRGLRDAVAELAVEHSVPEIWKHVFLVEERGAGRPSETIWRRGSAAGCVGSA